MSKRELVARIDAARWQLTRDAELLSDELISKLSVRGQLKDSIRRQPSVWGIGSFIGGFLLTRLFFGRKNTLQKKNAFYQKGRSPLFGPFSGLLIKLIFSMSEPLLRRVAIQKMTSLKKQHPTPHV